MCDSSNSSSSKSSTAGFDTLVFSGGGVKGLAYSGALLRLIERGSVDLARVHSYVGISIGSMFAFLLAIGYTPEELYLQTFAYDLYDLVDVNLTSVLFQWGITSTQKLEQFLQKMLVAKTVSYRRNITFGQLRENRGVTLRVFTTNLNTNELCTFDADSTPLVSIVKAVSMSMSLPFLFTPTLFRGDLHVDGALLESFPFRELEQNPRALGMRVCWDQPAADLSSADKYISRVVYCGLNAKTAHQISTLDEKTRSRLIMVEADVSTVKFQLEKEHTKAILDAGKRSVDNWLDGEKKKSTEM